MAGISLATRRRAIQASPTQGNYIRFEDPVTARLCIENFSTDGVGVTPEDAAAVTSIGYIFSGNTEIKSFNELKEFRITAIVGNSSSTGGAFKNSSIESLRLPNTVTSIQPYAFFGCTALVSLGKLPSSIISIGQSAFQGCSVLSDIELSHVLTSFGVAAFYKASALAIDIDEPNLTSIGNYAFAQSGITSITNLGKITALPDGASAGDRPGVFTNCKSLASVVLPNALTTIGAFAFYGNTALKSIDVNWSKITKISGSAFYNCTALGFDELNLPSLTSLSQNAFYGVNIKKLNLGALATLPNASYSSVENYGKRSVLEEIVLSNDITTLPSYSFYKYSALSIEVNFPNLLSIGQGVYNGTAITKISSLGAITSISGGNNIESTFYGCTSLVEVNLPDTLVYIGRNAFSGCTAMTTINYDWRNLQTIGEYAFQGCPSVIIEDMFLENIANMGFMAFDCKIKKMRLGSTLTTLPKCEHDKMPNYGARAYLEELIIDGDITNVPIYSFCNYTALKVIVFKTTTVPTLANVNAFSNTNNCPIFVPDESVEAYKTATNWSSLASRIYPLSAYEEFIAGDIIEFADPAVEAICLANWDTNGSGFLSKREAEAVTSIGTVFKGNTEITSFDELFIHFTRVTSLAAYAFNECTSLKFNGIESTHITTIGQWAFRQCSPTTGKVVLPNLTSAGNQAFANTSIEEVLDLGRITQLSANQWGAGVFSNCGHLTIAVLPETLTSIGYDPFAKCNSLQAIICKAVTPPTLGHQMALQSSDTNGCPIYVPDASVTEYQAATNWSSHTSRIKGISQLATDNPTLYAEIEEYL